MATIEKIRQVISDIAGRPNNVAVSEIEWVINQLKLNGFDVRAPRQTRHGKLYGIGPVRFGVCSHHPGGKQVKPCYVSEFLKAMIELGLYED